MATPSPTAERREEILGELAEWLHAAADKTRRMLMESEDVDEVVRLSAGLTKIARGVRQCVMVHDRLETGRLKAATVSAADRAEAHTDAVDRLKSRVSRAVGRRLEQEWPESDDLDDNDEFNARLEDFNERLDDLSGGEAFLTLDPDALIAQLCEEFGVTPPQPPLVPAKAGTQAECPASLAPHGSRLSPGRAGDGTHRPNGHAPNTS